MLLSHTKTRSENGGRVVGLGFTVENKPHLMTWRTIFESILVRCKAVQPNAM